MAQLVSSFNWSQVDPANNWHAAVISCDGSVNSTWDISMNGTDVNGTPVVVKYAIIDNSPNNAICSIIFGPFTFTIPPFTRRTFQLPSLPDDLYVLVTLGIVTVTLTDYDTQTPDEQNLQATQASVQNVSYPFLTIISSRAQLATDGNHSIIFSSASLINYSLLAASSAGNGFYNPTLVNRGTAIVGILPQGTDTINGYIGSPSSLVLAPGDSVALGCDGTTWWLEGNTTHETAEFSMAAQAAFTDVHNFRARPKHMEIWVRNKVAEAGFSVGDEVPWCSGYANGQDNTQQHVSVAADATYIYFARGGWNGNPSIPNKTTGAAAGMTLANWNFFVRAWTPA